MLIDLNFSGFKYGVCSDVRNLPFFLCPLGFADDEAKRMPASAENNITAAENSVGCSTCYNLQKPVSSSINYLATNTATGVYHGANQNNPEILSCCGVQVIPWITLQPTFDYTLLPLDPLQWTKDDVAHWLRETCERNGFKPVQPEQFPYNGRTLRLLDCEMFVGRAPHCGKMLYRDFRLRLARVLYWTNTYG